MKGDEASRWVADHRRPLAGWLGAAVTVAAMWGPWFATGSRARNSFGLFRAAQILGIEWVTPFRVAWFLLPVVLAAALALTVFGAHRTAGFAVLSLGAIVGGAGMLSLAGFGFFWGAAAAAVAGVGTVVGVIGGAVAAWARPRQPRVSRSSTALSTRS